MAQGTQICCCDAGIWCQVIGWIQIVSGALGIITAAIMLAMWDSASQIVLDASNDGFNQHSGLNQKNLEIFKGVEGIIRIVFILILVATIITTLIGVLLLVGTMKRSVGCLVGWIVIEVLMYVVMLVFFIVQAVNAGFGRVLPGLGGAPVFAATVWIVIRRIKDIKEGRNDIGVSMGDKY